ncbi:MAG TPA: type IV pilus secretin PilQ, partial [Thermoanaerobaculia bacterium]|nr:type IV pilus secretin PilQ [Thermoanaerobaculia bacterium]
DGSRVTLKTTGAPAYTSYSPSPGVFVVDLTSTTKESSVLIPSVLPPAVASMTADDVVEMGSHLTRITFRLTESLHPEVAAVEKAVVVTIPATAIAIETAAPAVEPLAPVIAAAPEPTPEPVVAEEHVAAAAPSGSATAEGSGRHIETALPRARMIRDIGAKSADGAVEVRIAADGALKYKAFRLEQPSRLVIDLDGVKNVSKKSAVAVDDELVKRVRVAQFQPTVARVVIDLAHKSEYTINQNGDELLVAFNGVARASSPTPQSAPEARATPAAATVTVTEKAAPADIPSQVPVMVADKTHAPVWRVPEPASKGAKKVISAPMDQAPPPQQQTTTTEDVFNEPAVPGAVRTLSGSRTLSGGPRVFTGEPISLNLKDADLKDVLRTFAELTGLNMAIDPGVGGSVTVDFQDVPWDQALDIILRQNSLTFTIEGNVMRIGTVDRIAAETAAQRRLADEERLNVPLTTLSFKLSYARALEVQTLLREIASPRARIIVDSRTNQLIISEIPAYLQTMQNLITTIDIPTRQVMIEARIVETSRTFLQQWGFTWGFGGDLDPALGTGTGLVFPNRINFTGGPFAFAAGNSVLSFHFFDVLGAFDLDFALSAAEAQGYTKVVSAPRVTTQDNTPAQIQSGFQIPYQTRINFTTTVQYLDATLQLQVTPQITEAGTVIMDIQVQKNQPATGLTIAGAAGTPLTTRSAKTKLMVRDGGTAVIAGIFQTTDDNAISRMPFVHNIPIIGALFRSHDVNSTHDELLIFITPRIVRG